MIIFLSLVLADTINKIMNKGKSGLIALIIFTVVVIIHFLSLNNIAPVPESILIVSRWILIVSIVVYALYKNSLTTWILASMVIGIEIGLDFPAFSQNLSVLRIQSLHG